MVSSKNRFGQKNEKRFSEKILYEFQEQLFEVFCRKDALKKDAMDEECSLLEINCSL